jgi:predicted GH43/DUF377 family glycosyl hydrolase
MTSATTSRYAFDIRRLGVVMEGDESDPLEAWGVLNPALARTRDGELLLFPRVVAAGNYSRVGIAKVLFDDAGDPVGVERLGYALEPEAWYEKNPRTAGVEDPRITFIPAIDAYVMAYSAYGPRSSRVALAVSRDAREWRRLGLVKFADERGVDFGIFDNKDAFFFPDVVDGPDGRPSLVLVHRPTFQISWMAGGMSGGDDSITVLPDGITEERAGIWCSYVALDELDDTLDGLVNVAHHTPIAFSEQPWEELKIGGGTQPVRLADGNWLAIFHGVRGTIAAGEDHQRDVHYAAGAMVHDASDPTRILHRSTEPLLVPELADELVGIVGNVVFPTALDDRGDGRIDVYYGMADAKIGVARLDVTVVTD